jgi:hypothetical protein
MVKTICMTIRTTMTIAWLDIFETCLPEIKNRSLLMFERLAEAEGKVHAAQRNLNCGNRLRPGIREAFRVLP